MISLLSNVAVFQLQPAALHPGPKDPRLFDEGAGWLPEWLHPDLRAAMLSSSTSDESTGGTGRAVQVDPRLTLLAFKA